MACELLSGFRMLDLTDDKGALCGKIFADLGADVIKVEPLQGCATRRLPPFLDDQPGADRSLYFLAYEAGKRSITLELESLDGRALLRRLVEQADFLVESFPAGYLDGLGLGYEQLSGTNPRLIHASILPFGDRGPGKDYRAADLTVWAAGGMMYMMGEPGKPPLQPSLPQAGLHAGAEAAVASLIAHYARGTSGRGQQVTVDMQACVAGTIMNEQAMPIMHGNWIRRSGMYSAALGVQQKMVFRCADGHISILIIGASGAPSTRALIDWMDEKGFAAPWMKDKAWETWAPGVFMAVTDEEMREFADFDDRAGRFFLTMTRREIFAEGLRRRILLAPVNSVADIAQDPQLAARRFFAAVSHQDTLARDLGVPGPMARLSATPIEPPRRSPQLGEHNQAVYGGLLRLSPIELTRLRATGAI